MFDRQKQKKRYNLFIYTRVADFMEKIGQEI